MEFSPEQTRFMATNWQSLAMETAEFPQPASPETITNLSQKLVFEALELVMPTPGEDHLAFGRTAVLLPSTAFNDKNGFNDEHSDPTLKQHVAGEFGDILWYEVAILSESGISIEELLENLVLKLGIPDFELGNPDSLSKLSEIAASQDPIFIGEPVTIHENPFVLYAGLFVSAFCRSIDPEYIGSGFDKDETINRGSDLLWATIYLLENYCDTNLASTLSKNYQKLKQREKLGIVQGSGTGTDHNI